MNDVSRLRLAALLPASPVPILHALFRRLDVYRRYLRAGLEIEALLSLDDRRLAARGLTRAEVGRAVFAKHGIALDRTQ